MEFILKSLHKPPFDEEKQHQFEETLTDLVAKYL